MKLISVIAAVGFAVSCSGTANAAEIIHVDFEIEITSQYYGGVITYIAPQHYTMSAQFESPSSIIWDTGTRTQTNYVLNQSSAIESDVFSLLPILAQQAEPNQNILGRTDDYSDVYLSTIGFGDSRFYAENGIYIGQTVTEFFFNSYEPSRGGTGELDGAMTIDKIRELLAVGNSTSYFIFDRPKFSNDLRTTWEGSITVTGLNIEAIGAVPEPSTWIMMILGFGFVGGAIRLAKSAPKSASSRV